MQGDYIQQHAESHSHGVPTRPQATLDSICAIYKCSSFYTRCVYSEGNWKTFHDLKCHRIEKVRKMK
jgi:hypothetical protein